MAQRIFVIGSGRFGTHLATRLSELGCDVILADRDPDLVEDRSQAGFHAVEMDAENDKALVAAGVRDADAVVVCIGENLQGSILATVLLRELKVKRLVCRAMDLRHAKVLEKLGADRVVLPSRDMAYRLAESLNDHSGSERQQLCEEYQLAHIRLGPPLHGKQLSQSGLRQRYQVNPVLLTRSGPNGQPVALEAEPDLTLALNDLLIVVGKREAVNRFERECGLPG